MAATGGKDDLLTTSARQLTDYLDTNVVGPHRVVLAFLDAMRKGSDKKIVLISSQSGSLTKQRETPRGFMGPYVGWQKPIDQNCSRALTRLLIPQAVTKSAVNMMAVQLHNELSGEGFTVVPLHPGERYHKGFILNHILIQLHYRLGSYRHGQASGRRRNAA